jgi:nucleotide-binding universal stress UspA family protein
MLHLGEAAMNEDAVFPDERDDVGHRGESHDVEVVLQVDAGTGRELEDGVGQLEDDTRAAEIAEALTIALGIDQRNAIGASTGSLMVIQNEDVDTAGANGFNLFAGICSAVDSDEEAGIVLLEASLHPAQAETVTLLDAVREEARDAGAKGGEESFQQGEGGYAVHIIVAIENDLLICLNSLEHPPGGGFHLAEEEGIAQVFQPGLKEIGSLLGGIVAIADEDAPDRFRESKLAAQAAEGGKIDFFRKYPTALHRRIIERFAKRINDCGAS